MYDAKVDSLTGAKRRYGKCHKFRLTASYAHMEGRQNKPKISLSNFRTTIAAWNLEICDHMFDSR